MGFPIHYRGSVDSPSDDFKSALSAAIDFVAPLVIKKQLNKTQWKYQHPGSLETLAPWSQAEED